MDSIFGVGLPELILILVLAGIVMGPERLVRTARTLGLLTARLQAFSRSFVRQMNAELASMDENGDLKSTVDELNQLRREMATLRAEVMGLTAGALTDTRQVAREIQGEVRSIAPPSLAAKASAAEAATTPKPAAPPAAQPHANGAPAEEPVYRPPSLFGDDGRNGASPQPPRPTLPKRVDVPDDPEE